MKKVLLFHCIPWPVVDIPLVLRPVPRYPYAMPSVYAMLLVTAASGLIAGAGVETFIFAAVSSVLATWFTRIPRDATEHLFANLDPLDPEGTHLLHAAREALNLIRRTGHPVLLRISAISRKKYPLFRVDVNREGDLTVCSGGKRSAPLKQPGVWIADHPLTLTLPHTCCATLCLTPSGQERVRASLATASTFPRGMWGAVALVAFTACAFDAGWLLAAALGFAFQAHLLEYDPHRSANQP